MRQFSDLPPSMVIEVISFLTKMEVIATFVLINKSNQMLLTSGNFLSSYLRREYEALKKHRHNYPMLLKSIIKEEIFELLSEPVIRENINLKTILSLEHKEFLLAYVVQQSQISLHLPYLQRAKIKKQPLEEKIKEKLIELEKYKFKYTPLLVDKFENLTTHDNESYLIQRETQFTKILQIFNAAIESDLTDHKENFPSGQLEFLKLFFNILFWKRGDIEKFQTDSQKFKNISEKFIKRYKIMDNGEIKEIKDADILDYSVTVNGFQLAVEIGNLHFLEECKQILSLLVINKITPSHHHPLKALLPTAVQRENESVLQFLLEQNFRCRSAVFEAIRLKKYMALILLISHGFNVTKIFFKSKTPWQMVCFREVDFMNLLVLHIAGVPINTGFCILKSKETAVHVSLLEYLLENIYLDLFKYSKIVEHLINKAEGIRLLICLGADLKRLNSKQVLTLKRLIKMIQPSISPTHGQEENLDLIDVSPLYYMSFYKKCLKNDSDFLQGSGIRPEKM